MAADYDPTNLDVLDNQEAQRAKAAEQKLAEEAADWRFILGDQRGRRIVWALLSKAGVFRVSFSADAMQMAFNEGNRNLGLEVLGKVTEHAPNAYLLMQNEAK